MKLKSFDYDTSLRVRLAYDDVLAMLDTKHRRLGDREKAEVKTRMVTALIDAAESGERDVLRLRAHAIRAIQDRKQ